MSKAPPSNDQSPSDQPTDETSPITGESTASAEASEALTLPVLPATNGVVFPEMVVTIALESTDARAAMAAATGGRILIVPKRGDDYATVGTVAAVESRGELPDGTEAVVVRGIGRAVVGSGVVGPTDALWVRAEPIDPSPEAEVPRDLVDTYREQARALLTELGGRRLAAGLDDVEGPSALADTAAWLPGLSQAQRVELLETIDTVSRLELATTWVSEALAEARVTKELRTEVNEKMEKTQREYVLRQQLAAIRKELGEDNDQAGTYATKLDDADLPSSVRAAVTKEVERLEQVGEQSQEYSWIATWLDTVFELPWNERTVDNLDLTAAREILDEDHTGLDEVKDRLVEHLAVRKLRAERELPREVGRGSGVILNLVGPPGVGKTSLGESVARALDRSFVRVALGGVRDEAEIRGHRRTYVGARPGRLVQALQEAGSMNPVILLDEIDKLGSDWRGDPSSALLEVLDPAQNHTFRDHYLEFELDLSDVIFIATANVIDSIPGPLLDRMEVITISGYSDDEKATIAADHLLPRLYRRNGIEPDELDLGDGVVENIIADYTREAGVRRLEQRLDRLVRKAVTELATGATTVSFTIDDLRDALGRPIPSDNIADRADRPGIATGLAVTGAGGDVLFVEVASIDGDPDLTLTGQLGDVMKESAEISRTYLRANAKRLGIPEVLDRHLHVHFPAGAVPKDGPSAGVTMTTALVSLLRNKAVRPEVAMTGEVTIQGRVLPIGGVKEKVLAAHRAGLSEVILPAKNGPDLEDVPDDVLAAMTIHLVDDVDEVIELALAV